MGRNEDGEEFQFAVGLTDNDPREHRALEAQWPAIFLMLCLFHISQAWRNALNNHLRVIPKGDPRKTVRKRLGKLLRQLLREITNYGQAIRTYNGEVLFYQHLRRTSPTIELSQKQAQGALSFLTYLRDYLKEESFWRSWSAASGIEAATRLNIPISSVIRTTNHLESFNGRLKHKYFAAYQKSGRLPRIDVYVLTLVKNVIPYLFEEHEEKDSQAVYRASLNTAHGPRPAKRIGAPESAASTTQPTAPHDNQLRAGDAPQLNLDYLEDDVEDDEADEVENPVLDADAEGYGRALDVPADNRGVEHDKLPDKEISSDHNSDLPSEYALDSDDIIPDLSSDGPHDVSYPLTQAFPESTSNILAGLDDEPHSSDNLFADLENEIYANDQRRAIIWRELMLQQDGVANSIRGLMELGVGRAELEEHVSTAVASRLDRPPAELIEESREKRRQPTDELEEEQAPKRVRFEQQKKAARKESYGFR